MSDSDELFGGDTSGDDTDELIAVSSKDKKPPAAKKKKGAKRSRLSKKKDSIPDADNDSDDDDGALVDSDDEQESKSASASAKPKKVLSKREKMEALKAKKRAAMDLGSSSSSSKNRKGGDKKGDKDDKGYDSGDSYNSAQDYVRTVEDDDFIDTRGEDEEMVAEYYADQHFDDERPDELEEMEVKEKKKRGGGGSSKKRGPDQLSEKDMKDKENPISMAVERMKKKKKVEKPFQEMLISAKELITRMEDAATEDDRSLREKKPGLKKLQMLPEVLDAMIDTKMMRPLLESEFLTVAKKWIKPLKDGSLGNVTLRTKMIDGIASMNREIDNDDLKRSEFGKLIMALYTHKKETPELKKKHKALIEQWSRRIFGKEGDMRNAGGAPMGRGERSLVGIARAQQQQAAMAASSESRSAKGSGMGGNQGDLGSVLSKGVKQARDLGRNRVRVPYSKGFQYSVRPENKTGDVADKKTRISSVKDQRESLHKRMLEKNKRTAKNSRSANISIEGRPTK